MILFHVTPKDVLVTLLIVGVVFWWAQLWWDARKYHKLLRKQREMKDAKPE